MERKRTGGPSSPPRSTRGATGKQPCPSDVVTRTFNLVTSRQVIPYYLLSGWFSFYYAPIAHSEEPPRSLDIAVFKVLPLIYLMEMVRHPPKNICPLHGQARRYILTGLILCSIGDGLFVWDPEYLYYACGTICLGYLSYSIAFYQYYQTSKWAKLMFPVGIACALILDHYIAGVSLSILVIVYAAFITLMGFFALARLELCISGPAYLGWSGVMLIALSDVMMALNVMVPDLERPVSDTVVGMTYFLGQLGIVLSTYTMPPCDSDRQASSSKSTKSCKSNSHASVRTSL